MKYLIIADWDANFHPRRCNTKETEEEAQALVYKLINDMPVGKEAPNAFYVEDPNVDENSDISMVHVIVDPLMKTISVDTVQQSLDATTRAAAEEIDQLEAGITKRRIVAAIVDEAADGGNDNLGGKGWISRQRTRIDIERGKL